MTSTSKIWKESTFILSNPNNFHSLEVVDFLGSRWMETAPTSIEVLLRPTLGQSDEPSDLRGSLRPTSVYSTWQSGVTHPIMNRARRCLPSVIEPITMSERRIQPYSVYISTWSTIPPFKHVKDKMWHQSAIFENSWPPFCQIWIIFTQLKLWIASARHNFKWVKIQIE